MPCRYLQLESCSSSVCMLDCASMQHQCALILYASSPHTVITARSHVLHHQQEYLELQSVTQYNHCCLSTSSH